jgi:hypothetical protein
MVPYRPVFPHQPNVKVQHSGRMSERSNRMTLYRYSMLVDLIVEGFAEGDGVPGAILGSGRLGVVSPHFSLKN